MSLLRKSQELKEIWRKALMEKNIPALIECYDKNFIFKGTMMKNSSRQEIDLINYFKNFSKKVESVTFFKNSHYLIENGTVINTGRYNFKTSSGIIKAQYVFVFNKKNKIISHYSNLYP